MPSEIDRLNFENFRNHLNGKILRYDHIFREKIKEEDIEMYIHIARNIGDTPMDELLSSDEVNSKEETQTGRTPTNFFRAIVTLYRAREKFTAGEYDKCAEYLDQTERHFGRMSANLLNDQIASESAREKAFKKNAKNIPAIKRTIELLEKRQEDGGIRPKEGWDSESKTAAILAPHIAKFIAEFNKNNPENKMSLFPHNSKRNIRTWLKTEGSDVRKAYLRNQRITPTEKH